MQYPGGVGGFLVLLLNRDMNNRYGANAGLKAWIKPERNGGDTIGKYC